jgi:predicted enzyme related to lactoylglutathione lyase
MKTDNPVDWFEIYVEDVPAAKAFYEGVLGVKLERLATSAPGIAEMWAFPMRRGAPGAAGALVKMPGGPSGGNATIVYFACDDCAHEASRARSHRGEVKKEKTSIGEYGYIALLTDPEGNIIGLHSMK